MFAPPFIHIVQAALGPSKRGRLSVATRCVAVFTGFLLVGCVAPRDTEVTLKCNTNAQCPADGKHFCNLDTQLCELCSGNCPGVGSTSSSSGGTTDAGSSSGTTDSTTATDSGTVETPADDVVTDDGSQCVDPKPDGKTTCACLCQSDQPKPESATECYCDKSCEDFGDCCDDAPKYCGWGGTADPDVSTSDATTGDASAGDGSGIAGGESCVGWCGKETAPPGSTTLCLCYEKCVDAGLCCADYKTVCSAPDASQTDTVQADTAQPDDAGATDTTASDAAVVPSDDTTNAADAAAVPVDSTQTAD